MHKGGAKEERTALSGPDLEASRKAGLFETVSRGIRDSWHDFKPRFSGLGSCLLYHHVCKSGTEGNGHLLNGLSVPVDLFDEQIEYLSRTHRCLSVDEAISLLRRRRLPERSAMITFDDGYRDNLEYALPVLERWNVPATIFVTTGFIEGECLPWWDELALIAARRKSVKINWQGVAKCYNLTSHEERARMANELSSLLRSADLSTQKLILAHLDATPSDPDSELDQTLSWSEVRDLDRHPLITIGAHTRHHLKLSALSDDASWRQLSESKSILERQLGHQVRHLAFPFGSADAVSAREKLMAQQLGFSSAFVTTFDHIRARHHATPFELPRITIDHRDHAVRFRRKLRGVDAFIWKYLKPEPSPPPIFGVPRDRPDDAPISAVGWSPGQVTSGEL